MYTWFLFESIKQICIYTCWTKSIWTVCDLIIYRIYFDYYVLCMYNCVIYFLALRFHSYKSFNLFSFWSGNSRDPIAARNLKAEDIKMGVKRILELSKCWIRSNNLLTACYLQHLMLQSQQKDNNVFLLKIYYYRYCYISSYEIVRTESLLAECNPPFI